MAGQGTDYQLLTDNPTEPLSEEDHDSVVVHPHATDAADLWDLTPAAVQVDKFLSTGILAFKEQTQPQGYEAVDPDEDQEDQGSGGSTQEYQSSRAIDPDLFDDDEENDVMGLQPPRPIGQNLHFTRSKRLLFACGVTSVLLGVAIALCGVAAFVLVPQLQSRHSFQVRSSLLLVL